MLLGVQVASDDFDPIVPRIGNLTPLATQVQPGFASAIFQLVEPGLGVLEIDADQPAGSGEYTVELYLPGDANADAFVDGLDNQLFSHFIDDAVGSVAGVVTGREAPDGSVNHTPLAIDDPTALTGLDGNRDGTLDVADMQLFAANLGFAANQPPTVLSAGLLTHEDLPLAIAAQDLAVDPDGDVFYLRVRNAQSGTVRVTGDGSAVIFVPDPGHTGSASFEISADDGFAASAWTTVSVTVSDAPLTSIEILRRTPALDVGEVSEVLVTGDFTDEAGVLLPASYLTLSSTDPSVLSVTATAQIVGASDGTAALVVSRGAVATATAVTVGTLTDPTHRRLAVVGLDAFPGALTLAVDNGARQFLAGVDNEFTLTDASTGTVYVSGNTSVVSIDADGLATAQGVGATFVTIINGPAEARLPVRVVTPQVGTVALGAAGGVVRGSDGSEVAVPPGVLDEGVMVSIEPVTEAELPVPLADGFTFAGGFDLNVGDTTFDRPVQLAVPVAPSIPEGTTVVLARADEIMLPDGTMAETWVQTESAVVGADGFARTTSPPFPGVVAGGRYVSMVTDDAGNVRIRINYNWQASRNTLINAAAQSVGGIGLGLLAGFAGMVDIEPFFEIKAGPTRFAITSIDEEGVPYSTTLDLEVKAGQVTTVDAVINNAPPPFGQAYDPPAIDEARFVFDANKGGIVELEGRRITYANPNAPSDKNLGNDVMDIRVEFEIPLDGTVFSGEVLPSSTSSKLRVKIPDQTPLGLSLISVVRPQYLRGDGDWEVLVNKRSNRVNVNVPAEYVFVPLGSPEGTVAVIDTAATIPVPGQPGQTQVNPNRNDLIARIPIRPGGPTVTTPPPPQTAVNPLANAIEAVQPQAAPVPGPFEAGNTGSVTVRVELSSDPSSPVAVLLGPAGQRIEADTVYDAGGQVLYPTFDLTGADVGTYELRIESPDGDITVTDVFEVIDGTSSVGGFHATLSVRPDAVAGEPFSLFIDYGNDGVTNVPAPLLLLSAAAGAGEAFADPTTGVGALQLLALADDGPADVLRPGTTGRIEVLSVSADAANQFLLAPLDPDTARAIDWSGYRDVTQPETVAPLEWEEMLFDQFTESIGATWGDYEQAARDAARRRGAQGVRDAGAIEMLGFAADAFVGTGVSTLSGVLLQSPADSPIADTTILAVLQGAGESFSARRGERGRRQLSVLWTTCRRLQLPDRWRFRNPGRPVGHDQHNRRRKRLRTPGQRAASGRASRRDAAAAQ